MLLKSKNKLLMYNVTLPIIPSLISLSLRSQVSKGSELLAATKKGGAHATAGLEPSIDPNVDAKLSAYVKKLLFIRHRAGTSQDLHDRSATELQNVPPAEPAEQLTTIVEGFK